MPPVRPVRLFGYWRSSSTWRVRIGLQFKGLEVETVPVHLRDGVQHSAAHDARNPMKQVPVLELSDGSMLTESLAILQWLDEAFPEPPLLPADPLGRARVRQAAELINAGIQPLQNFQILGRISDLGGDQREWGQWVIAKGFAALERFAEQHAGEHLVGDAISLADVCLVPQMYNARRFGVDLSKTPNLVRLDAAAQAHPAFQTTHPDRQPDAD
jgi:maleylpyruvate isomerase